MAKLDIECCHICCAPVKAIETCNSVRFEYDGPRWISVEERLPEGEVLAANFAPGTYGYKDYLRGYVCKHDDFYYAENSFEILDTVTHWMPLPSTEGIK